MFIHILPPFSDAYLGDVVSLISWRKERKLEKLRNSLGKQWGEGGDQGSFLLKAIALGSFKHSLKNKKELP